MWPAESPLAFLTSISPSVRWEQYCPPQANECQPPRKGSAGLQGPDPQRPALGRPQGPSPALAAPPPTGLHPRPTRSLEVPWKELGTPSCLHVLGEAGSYLSLCSLRAALSGFNPVEMCVRRKSASYLGSCGAGWRLGSVLVSGQEAFLPSLLWPVGSWL